MRSLLQLARRCRSSEATELEATNLLGFGEATARLDHGVFGGASEHIFHLLLLLTVSRGVWVRDGNPVVWDLDGAALVEKLGSLIRTASRSETA